MKKQILSLLPLAFLTFAANAATEMCVEKIDGTTVCVNVDRVVELYYEEVSHDQGVTVSGTEGNYTFVDLGLPSGTKWATYNVGASKPYEFGDVFAWGETKPKEKYGWSTYKWFDVLKGKITNITKYNTVDRKIVLDAEDDAATANWGSSWRMPTEDELDELFDGCYWMWIEDFYCSGVSGRLGTSKTNGAFIFLPAAGLRNEQGDYWTSSVSQDNPINAYERAFWDNDVFRGGYSDRSNGWSVRAVFTDGKYTVNFYTQDGKLIESQMVEAGKAAVEVKGPIVDGYDFIGWDDSSFVNVRRYTEVHAVYVEQLPDLYVDVEGCDTVVFRQDGKTGYFIVEKATTDEVKLKVFWEGMSNVVTLSDSYGSFCSRGLQMVDSSSAVNNPSQIVFAKAVNSARIQSPTFSANAVVSSSAPETRFERHAVAQGVVTVSGIEGNYTYVDLGLPSGTKWATYNVGATKTTEYGDYFAWGETEPKKNYSWATYKLCDGHDYYMTKYNTMSYYGPIDKKSMLEAEDDAATANWGSEWRMPTTEEQKELLEGCDWEWVENFNGSRVNGMLGTSKANGSTIFLPAAGYGEGNLEAVGEECHYWSSSLVVSSSSIAYHLEFSDSKFRRFSNQRRLGKSVRAVLK